MSIESNLASIAKSLETIAGKLGDERRTEAQAAPAPAASMTPNAVPQMAQMPAAAAAATPAAAPFVPAVVPAVVPPVMPAAAVPPAPAPAPAAAPAGPLPFADHKALMEYVMGKYRALGPIKGGLIQNALTELGLHNINDLKPEHYAAFHTKVEAIQ